MAGAFLYEKELAWFGLILGIVSTLLLIRVSMKQHELAEIHLAQAKNGK